MLWKKQCYEADSVEVYKVFGIHLKKAIEGDYY